MQHLIGLDLVRRFDPKQWQTLWHLPQGDLTDFSVVKLQIGVEAEPSLNVKTT